MSNGKHQIRPLDMCAFRFDPQQGFDQRYSTQQGKCMTQSLSSSLRGVISMRKICPKNPRVQQQGEVDSTAVSLALWLSFIRTRVIDLTGSVGVDREVSLMHVDVADVYVV